MKKPAIGFFSRSKYLLKRNNKWVGCKVPARIATGFTRPLVALQMHRGMSLPLELLFEIADGCNGRMFTATPDFRKHSSPQRGLLLGGIRYLLHDSLDYLRTTRLFIWQFFCILHRLNRTSLYPLGCPKSSLQLHQTFDVHVADFPCLSSKVLALRCLRRIARLTTYTARN